MVPLLALLAVSMVKEPVSVTATESVWVYSRASDPAGDQFLRIWGVSGLATPEGKGEGEDWSYGYLKWDIGSLPDKSPKSATLTVYNINPVGFGDAIAAKATPLEARPLVGSFTGKGWDYSFSIKNHPDLAKTMFGFGAPVDWGSSKEPIPITIDLMKGPGDFKSYLAAAKTGKDHALQIALTSAIDPGAAEGGGKGGVYKVYSATADAKLRPTLTVEY
jgi:hypothetical protein